MTIINAEHIEEATRLLGKKMLDYVDGGRQALLLTDQTYLCRFGLGAVNRDVNFKWVDKLKMEMMRLAGSRERTTITVCINLVDIQQAIEEQNGASDFKSTILDGQHRVEALKQLYEDNPGMKYEFYCMVYIVSKENEMMKLIEDFDKRLIISTKDKKVMQSRSVFMEAFLAHIPNEHHHRRCITGTKNHKLLREEVIVQAMEAITTKEEMVQRMENTIQKYKQIYDRERPKSTSILAKVIEDSKFYPLITWEKGLWIYDILNVTPNKESVL
jgi:hypothetical protein